MTDSYGAYVCQIFLPADAPVNNGVVGRGAGAPGVNTPLWFLAYIDSNNGNLYVNETGLTSGWVLVTGGGGGGSNNKSGNGSPVGVVTPDYTGQFYSDEADPNSVKLWVSTGPANSNWNNLIA